MSAGANESHRNIRSRAAAQETKGRSTMGISMAETFEAPPPVEALKVFLSMAPSILYKHTCNGDMAIAWVLTCKCRPQDGYPADALLKQCCTEVERTTRSPSRKKSCTGHTLASLERER